MTVKKTIFIISVIPLLFFLIYLSRVIIMPFIIAFFLAYALNPMVEFLQKKGARRDWAILTIYTTVFVCGALILELLIPRLIRDLTAIIQRLPAIINDLQTLQIRFTKLLDSWNLPVNPEALIDEIGKRTEAGFKNFTVLLGRNIIQFFSQSTVYILIPLIAYYFSRDYPRLKKHIFSWLLKYLGSHWTQTFIKIDTVFKYYIRSQTLDILMVSMLYAVGLSILGFDTAILLGFIAGIFNVIPYFGPILGALPVIIFALLKSSWLALYVILLFFIVNQIEVIFLSPRIISNTLKLHPVTVIYLIVLGGEIFGLAGMVFAVPLGAIIGIIIKSIYEICFDETNNGQDI